MTDLAETLTKRISHGLVALFALATIGCGAGADDGGTGTGTGTGGATTGGTGATSAPTGGATTGSTGAASTSTSEGTVVGTSDATSETTAVATTTTGEATTGGVDSTSGSSSGGPESLFSFFVSSDKSLTGDLGGLAGADQRCQDLAAAVGEGGKTWHAYLSAEKGPNDGPVHAKDRIGTGPWFNAKGKMVATDLGDLHAKDGDYMLFVDEHGEAVPGQWEGSPAPVEHDILTGSNKDGTLLVGKTCADWTSEDAKLVAQVGHSDGLGPMMSDAAQYRPWNSVHENGGCNDTAPKGGAGRIYCFAVN